MRQKRPSDEFFSYATKEGKNNATVEGDGVVGLGEPAAWGVRKLAALADRNDIRRGRTAQRFQSGQ
jgi:hypothetical protein